MSDPKLLIEQAQARLLTSTQSGVWFKTHRSSAGAWKDGFALLDQAKAAIAPTPPTTTGSPFALLRNSANDPIPSNFTPYRYVILNPTFAPRVEAWSEQFLQTKFLAYKDLPFAVTYSTDIFGNAGVPFGAMQDSWFLKDLSGKRVQSVNYNGQLYFADVGDPGYQNACYQQMKEFLAARPGYSGFFLDDMASDMAWHLGGANYAKLAKYPSRNAYRAALRSLLVSVCEKLHADGLLTLPNVGAAWDQPDVYADWGKISGLVLRENFCRWTGSPVFLGADWKLHVDAMKSCVDAGAGFVALTYGASTETKQRDYVAATFMLFHEPSVPSAFCWANGTAVTVDWIEKLGNPTGKASQSGSIWSREFEHGEIRVYVATGTATAFV